jgi:ABC-type antimicrobial peptide transport system permease subunit
VIAHAVSQRTSEIGVRMALGASQGEVVGLFLREGMAIAGLGITLGILGALALGRLIRDQLFGVASYDATTLAAIGMLLAVVTALACTVPARRAARVDPAISLREG